jgi:tetratricopeptide (TPR) repeat protein
MISSKTRRLLGAALAIACAAAIIYLFSRTSKSVCPVKITPKITATELPQISEGFVLLKSRKDKEAVVIFEQILAQRPGDLDALWGKAEVLRRSYHYKESEDILNMVLEQNPKDYSALNSLAYIKYKNEEFSEALKILNRILNDQCADKENRALAYLTIGGIYSKLSSKGFLNKIKYGTQIRSNFLKAYEFAPDMPEVHLALGTFYLLAPSIVGGDLNKALEELQIAIKITPEFATANGRLAQAYKKQGDKDKYNLYLKKTRELDPENEVLKELQ